MKKVSLILAALALVLGTSQCKKQEEPAASGQKQHIVLNASFGDSNAKIAEDGTGGLKWTVGDVINVSQNGQSLSVEGLKCTNAENGTFEGEITETTGNITFTFGELKYTEQTGELNDAISLTAEAPYDKNGNYNVTMNMPHAVLKLDLSAFASNDRDGVTVTITSGDEPLASVLNITPASKAVYVALPIEGTGSKKYTFKGNGRIFEKAWTLVANAFYTLSGSTTGEAFVIAAYPEGALPGLFTVNESGKQVYFSQGNLQFHTTNKIWRFAENQYDMCDAKTDYHSTSDYAENSDKWIDLFGWGTSGYNHGANCYRPWSTSISAIDYYAYGDEFKGLYDDDGSADWGYNKISNGGDTEGKWRTLSKSEWAYLLNNHSSKWVTVNGVNGYVIAPDGFVGTLSDSYLDDAALAANNLVFLPAAGRRSDGIKIRNVGSSGRYWSSTAYDRYQAYQVFFFISSEFEPDYFGNRDFGISVRLVKESK